MDREIVRIPANEEVSILKRKNDTKLKVAAYCRVSTKSKDQLHSYHTQIAYYVDLISKNENWIFVDLYADEGISGMKTSKREEFNRMIEDCRKGMIDMIIVKSISRFARNVVDCLEYIRELRSMNVDVYFQNENQHGINPASEFVITIHAMYAQEQSVSISNNMRWAIKKQMQNGTWIPNYIGYGYKINEYEIIKDVEVSPRIETIKNLYLQGYSADKIKSILESRKIPSPAGNEKWNANMIRFILSSPLYRGDLLAQRTYTTKTFPFERRTNHGEIPRYHYPEDHEPYINAAEAKKIDHIMMIRRSRTGNLRRFDKETKCYLLSGKVICGNCGNKMKRIINSYTKEVSYACCQHIKDRNKCTNKSIKEEEIYNAFVRMFNKLKYRKDLLDSYLKDLKLLTEKGIIDTRYQELKKEYEDIKKQIYKSAVDYNSGLIESAFFADKIKSLRKRARENLKLQALEILTSDFQQISKETEEINKVLIGNDYLMKFSKMMFMKLVENVVVEGNGNIIFHLKNGMKFSEKGES